MKKLIKKKKKKSFSRHCLASGFELVFENLYQTSLDG